MKNMHKKFSTKPVNIYVLENDAGYIKIGVTQNFEQRLKSLSGSNSGGNIITRYWVSRDTLLYSFEHTLHLHYQDNRIKGTEWFKDLNFSDVICYIQLFMQSDDFIKCEEIRQNYYINYAK